jgi:hypothetical protein
MFLNDDYWGSTRFLFTQENTHMPQVCKAILILVSLLAGAGALSSAQQMHALPPKPGPITVVDIIQMSHAGLSDDVIV